MKPQSLVRSMLFLFTVMLSGFSYAESVNVEPGSVAAKPVAASGLLSLTDEELANENGQALFNLSYLPPGATGNNMSLASGVGIYTLSMEAQLELNANIRNLQLGCGGSNGAGGCDVEIQNFSLGCIANSAGVCVSLPPTTTGTATNSPATHTVPSGTVTDTLGNQTQMKDFVLTNPFYQFAIRNPDKASTREIVGLRIGAASSKGPMSFNDIISFSGYLSGLADITMQGQTNTALTSTTGYAPTGTRTPAYDYNLGLSNWCLVSIIFCVAQADEYQVKFDGQHRLWAVDNSGTRFSQGYIRDTDLDQVVRGVVDTVSIVRTYNAFGTGLGNAILGIISDNVYNKIMGQLAAGLGIPVASVPGYDIPYNLSNVGSLDVDSKDFGISVQSIPISYPGYYSYAFNTTATTRTAANYVQNAPVYMQKGWTMYLPNAFTLNISQPMSDFTNTILTGAAAQGNIVGLPAPYRNCWGTLTFC